MPVLHRPALKNEKGLSYFEIPEITAIPWLQLVFLTRKGGSSLSPFESLNFGTSTGDSEEHVSENKSRIASTFGFEPDRLLLLRQMHRDQVLVLKQPYDHIPSKLEYDAAITDASQRWLGIKTADCLPILIVDQRKKVVAAVHAGRQGTACHIIEKVLGKMSTDFGSSTEDLLIVLGPAIGPCCYEIDETVFVQEWKPFSIPNGNGRWKIDLARINREQILRSGLREGQIFSLDLCTRCQPDLFFSYRGEGRTGRQLSFVGIR